MRTLPRGPSSSCPTPSAPEPSSPIMSCVTLDKLLHLSGLICELGIMKLPSVRWPPSPGAAPDKALVSAPGDQAQVCALSSVQQGPGQSAVWRQPRVLTCGSTQPWKVRGPPDHAAWPCASEPPATTAQQEGSHLRHTVTQPFAPLFFFF